MKKYFVIIFFFLISIPSLYASHISGGEIYYRFISYNSVTNTDRIQITLRLFRDCEAHGERVAEMPNGVALGIFRKTGAATYTSYQTLYSVPRTRKDQIEITTSAYPCIRPAPENCYEVGYFDTTINIPRDPLGYIISFQTCCRAEEVTNLQPVSIPGTPPTLGEGATYLATVPGTNVLGNMHNSSPLFSLKDTTVVCANNNFTLDFSASDPDGDNLFYSFCSAYDRGSADDADTSHAPSTPPYNFINYKNGFSGSQPLGPNVTIDPTTGIITGIAPAPGKYVINVCIDEYRGGVKIGEHRKDFILIIKSCDRVGAFLKPSYLTCDGYTLFFQNESNSPLVNSWYWDFGVAGSTTDISTLQKPSYTFPAAGDYIIKLVVNKGQQCTDSATTIAKVYPGFVPGFRIDGGCILNNFIFTDTTKTSYGTVNKWSWKFGDETTIQDTSTKQNPTWKYSTTGFKKIEFIVGSSNGCLDTLVVDSAEVRDKPKINLAFRDTLICSVDTLQLKSSGRGLSSWSPGQPGIALFASTPNPEVFPKTTTTFTLTLNDDGCINTDSVKVRVVDFVTLDAGPDTTICLTDPVTLKPSGDGLYYTWTPSFTLDDPTKRNPIATPTQNNTTYHVLAKISAKCTAQDDITVFTIPYPISNAGSDNIICYDDTTQLSGSMDGSSFIWSPASSLINANTLTPLAYPLITTDYILSVYDIKGCPKPGRDTVKITVRPEIFANAGHDTSIVSGQPLLLNASGATFFEWSPPFGLNSTNIQRPTAMLTENMTYFLKAYTAENCVDYDTINIKVFKTSPDIFVPNAFTPGRASNSLFRPIPVGIARLDFFRIYNRWGQQVYSSTDIYQGWDGKLGGKDQNAGTYVWMVKGTDYTGKVIFRKGTMVLIR